MDDNTKSVEQPTKESSDTKETYLWKAKLAQEANRYDDMATFMGLVMGTGIPMTKEEDNMLAVAYKRLLDSKRSSRRTLSTIIERSTESWEVDVARRYREAVDKEIRTLCTEVLSVIRGWLSSAQAADSDPATGVFYLKLCGDYNRYAAEVTIDQANRDMMVADSRAAYERADELGRQALQPIHPIRLGLMLNYSVFLYQVCQERKRGHDLAKRAFDDAVAEIDSTDHPLDDTTLILRLIRDNLTIWRRENGGVSFETNEVSSLIPQT